MDLSELAPVATLVVASVALFVGLRTIRQRDLADRRDRWRDQGRPTSPWTPTSDARPRVLELLAASRLAGAEEIDLLDEAVTVELDRRPALLDYGWTGGHEEQVRGDGTEHGRRAVMSVAEAPLDESAWSPAEHRARISAARLEMTIGERRGEPTPSWIRELAEQPRAETETETERRGRGSAA